MTGCSRKPESWTALCCASIARRSAASAESCAAMDVSQAARLSAAISSASSRYGLRMRHRSGLIGGMDAHRRRRRGADSMMQIHAALLPVALDSALGDSAHRGDLGEGEAAEELQVDDLGEPRFDLGKLVERIADQDQRLRVDDALGVIGAERGDFEQPAPLLRSPPPDVVDDQAAHDPRRIGHEARLIDENGPLPSRDREVSLVQQGGDTQTPGRAAAAQFTAGEPGQLGVERGERGVGQISVVRGNWWHGRLWYYFRFLGAEG